MSHRMHKAFTLIELLVVVSIIVLLLSLLAPAMDRAINMAELAKCASQVRGIGSGGQLYAMSHDRHYPDRPYDSPEGIYGGHQLFPHQLSAGTGQVEWGSDLRVQLKDYVAIAMYLDPLLGGVDLSFDAAPSRGKVLANYSMYFGWGYTVRPLKRMRKIGDHWSYDGGDWYGDGKTLRMSVLVADHERANFFATNGHQDKDAKNTLVVDQAIDHDPWVLSRWMTYPVFANDHDRGPVDQNYGFDDGSVRTVSDVLVNHPNDSPTLDDERMVRVPTNSGGLGTIEYRNLPRQQ